MQCAHAYGGHLIISYQNTCHKCTPTKQLLQKPYVCPVGSKTGSLKQRKEMGQKKVAGAPASAACTSRSLLSGPSGLIPIIPHMMSMLLSFSMQSLVVTLSAYICAPPASCRPHASTLSSLAWDIMSCLQCKRNCSTNLMHPLSCLIVIAPGSS